MRLHFDRISTEPAWDYVQILDGDDNIVEIYTAEEYDLWTPWIDGYVAQILLTSDGGTNDWGFSCDSYEAETTGAPLVGAQVRLSLDDRVTYTSDQGTFTFTEVDVGTHAITPSHPLWEFDPSNAQVSISPGTERGVFFYASSTASTAASTARHLADDSPVTISGVVVTAVFDGFFYVEDADRSAGIRIISTEPVTRGATLDISGTMSTSNGERAIIATQITGQ